MIKNPPELQKNTQESRSEAKIGAPGTLMKPLIRELKNYDEIADTEVIQKTRDKMVRHVPPID